MYFCLSDTPQLNPFSQSVWYILPNRLESKECYLTLELPFLRYLPKYLSPKINDVSRDW